MALARAGAAPFDKLRLGDKAANRLRHSVSDAIGQRRELPLEPHLQTE